MICDNCESDVNIKMNTEGRWKGLETFPDNCPECGAKFKPFTREEIDAYFPQALVKSPEFICPYCDENPNITRDKQGLLSLPDACASCGREITSDDLYYSSDSLHFSTSVVPRQGDPVGGPNINIGSLTRE
ncbi:MAG: hypothetical protein K8T10_03840 [Candidatus Eremiobacteraeota bacterium]|nr:hypothetical protein [Candidatus Eremiobacteraeota bacterium]